MWRAHPRSALVAVLLVGLAAPACGPLRRLAYAGPDRDSWQQPERVVKSLAIAPGARVADIGAGGGYFTWRLAEAAGAAGRVYAVDVDPDMTSYLEDEARGREITTVRVVLAALDDPKLPESVDLVFVCNTFHHIGARADYFRRVGEKLRPGGRVAIVEYKETGWLSRWLGHHTHPETIQREMREAGFERVESFDWLERQSFQIFAPTG